jgi:hypothetical protein
MTQKIMLKTKLLSRTSCSAFLRSLTCGLTTIMIMVSLLLLSPTLAGDRTANTTANYTTSPAKTPKTCNVGAYLIWLHDPNGLASLTIGAVRVCTQELASGPNR